jgi:hypothetical protein
MDVFELPVAGTSTEKLVSEEPIHLSDGWFYNLDDHAVIRPDHSIQLSKNDADWTCYKDKIYTFESDLLQCADQTGKITSIFAVNVYFPEIIKPTFESMIFDDDFAFLSFLGGYWTVQVSLNDYTVTLHQNDYYPRGVVWNGHILVQQKRAVRMWRCMKTGQMRRVALTGTSTFLNNHTSSELKDNVFIPSNPRRYLTASKTLQDDEIRIIFVRENRLLLVRLMARVLVEDDDRNFSYLTFALLDYHGTVMSSWMTPIFVDHNELIDCSLSGSKLTVVLCDSFVFVFTLDLTA